MSRPPRRLLLAGIRYLPNKHWVLWDELRRRLRGNRTYGVLLSFILALCGMLTVVFIFVQIGTDPLAWPRFGRVIFFTASIGQGILLILISPGLTATTFSSEREARRLEFLLLTRLKMRTLVYDKFLAAVFLILLILLCGAPVIAIITATFGGISPLEFIFAYLGIILCGLFCASTALLYSCKAKNSSAALVQGYLISLLGLSAIAALSFCFIGPVLAILEIIRNLNHTVKRLEDWRKHREEDPYALPMMNGFEDNR